MEPFREIGLEGDVAVFRECLVDGPVDSQDPETFFLKRSKFLTSDEDQGFYESSVRPEIEKIIGCPEDGEIYLWFEHELFCQVNLWFLLSRLASRKRLFFVGPPAVPFEDRFGGWAPLSPAQLFERFELKIPIDEADRNLGAELWAAFSRSEGERLLELGSRASDVFIFLEEVSRAAAGIGQRPESIVKELVAEKTTNFGDVFRRFCEREPVYGFGDLQVKRIWDRVTAE